MKEIKPPHPIPVTSGKIFLAGSIEMGSARDWQKEVKEYLEEESNMMNITILNPRRDDWNSSWEQDIFNSHFYQQVNWELNALEKSDIIYMYFDPNTKSPISLLELGLFAQSKKLIVCCPHGFWRKGNVDITCDRYGIPFFDDFKISLVALVQLIKNQKNASK